MCSILITVSPALVEPPELSDMPGVSVSESETKICHGRTQTTFDSCLRARRVDIVKRNAPPSFPSRLRDTRGVRAQCARDTQHRRGLRFHVFPERSMSFPMERDVEDLLQLVLAGENAAAEMAEARTAMEDFMVRSRVVTLSEGRRQQDPRPRSERRR